MTNDLARPYSVSRVLILQKFVLLIVGILSATMCFSWMPHMTCKTKLYFPTVASPYLCPKSNFHPAINHHDALCQCQIISSTGNTTVTSVQTENFPPYFVAGNFSALSDSISQQPCSSGQRVLSRTPKPKPKPKEGYHQVTATCGPRRPTGSLARHLILSGYDVHAAPKCPVCSYSLSEIEWL